MYFNTIFIPFQQIRNLFFVLFPDHYHHRIPPGVRFVSPTLRSHIIVVQYIAFDEVISHSFASNYP